MTKEEFMSELRPLYANNFLFEQKKPTDEQYRTVEYVYTNHPSIPIRGGKKRIAQLWALGGYRLILDMMPTAQEAREHKNEILKIRADIRANQRAIENSIYKLSTQLNLAKCKYSNFRKGELQD